MELKVLVNSPPLISVALSGALNTPDVEEIEPKLTELTTCQGQDVVVDISGVSYINSLGIAMFINISNRVKRMGSKFVLLKPQPNVANIIQISRLSQTLGVVNDESTLNPI